eukprot:403358875
MQVRYLDPKLRAATNLFDPDQTAENETQQDISNQWQLIDVNRPLLGDQTYKDSLLTMGPPIKDGFYYDFQTQQVVTEKDYKTLESSIKSIIKKNLDFERLVISKEEALDMFSYNKFKTHLIENKVPDNAMTSVYKIGDFIDLCTGPHLKSTGLAKGFAITKHSSAYWLGNQKNESLQRIYGISFHEKEELKEYERIRQEALKRDHRVLGQNQNLFFFSKFSPGSAFFLAHGTKIYNKLVDLMRTEYLKRGYQEVISPNLFHIDLWKTSGHYKNYKENLYLVNTKDQCHSQDSLHQHEAFGLKPMNCPGHCLIFKNSTHSYKELPIRYADFGVLHRNEISGALSGLTRDQIEQEIEGCLNFLNSIYSLFGFKWDIFLSTKPESSMGSDEQWSEAETQLQNALNRMGKPWKLNKGDGAFYGPKIDIIIYDTLGRAIQCGTIQLDFQLPIRFNLQYNTSHNQLQEEGLNHDNSEQNTVELASETFDIDEHSPQKFEWKEQPLKRGHERPVIIHRAILGSVERFIAILTEHLAGKWPIWLSPRQICICPISEKHLEYSTQVKLEMHNQINLT